MSDSNSRFKIGDRVRMVQTGSEATVVGELKIGTGADGGNRLPVRWDKTGIINEWNPDFLRAVGTNPADDPDEVIVGCCGRRRERTVATLNGVTLLVPEGFFRTTGDAR